MRVDIHCRYGSVKTAVVEAGMYIQGVFSAVSDSLNRRVGSVGKRYHQNIVVAARPSILAVSTMILCAVKPDFP